MWSYIMESPLGPILLAANHYGDLVRADFLAHRSSHPCEHWPRDPVRVRDAVKQIDEYFAGKRKTFSLQLGAEGTKFQQEVWAALCEIPFGETRSYGELAKSLGKPNASRAVGRANATNPIAIVVPCHRVIGSDHSLTGYAGGLPIKQALLDFESGGQYSGARQAALPFALL
jgi:methylated-DNA-[protein]-cysteine S-methyltransferase